MVYTDYFTGGSEPTTYCDQHPTHGILTRLAGMLGAGDAPTPPRVDDVVVPAAMGTNGVIAPATLDQPPPPPAKKRGFWSRLFGTGKDTDKAAAPDPQDQTELPKKKTGG